MTITSLLPAMKPPAPAQRRVSHETLKSIFSQVRNDPLAGKGCLSQDEILIDKILAHVNVVTPGGTD
jgi:hypothetical protein